MVLLRAVWIWLCYLVRGVFFLRRVADSWCCGVLFVGLMRVKGLHSRSQFDFGEFVCNFNFYLNSKTNMCCIVSCLFGLWEFFVGLLCTCVSLGVFFVLLVSLLVFAWIWLACGTALRVHPAVTRLTVFRRLFCKFILMSEYVSAVPFDCRHRTAWSNRQMNLQRPRSKATWGCSRYEHFSKTIHFCWC